MASATPSAHLRPMQIVHDFPRLSTHTGDVRAGLAALQAQGVGGIVTNMPFERYMQDPALWSQFRHFLRTCHDLGLRLWIYDEAGYPSGYAGGQLLAARPDLEATVLYRDPATGTMGTVRNYEGTHNCNNHYAKSRTANLLEPDAVQEFLRFTHERYAAELGSDLHLIEAFFTDEPTLNALYFPPIPVAANVPVLDVPDPDRVLYPMVPWSGPLAAKFDPAKLGGLFCDEAGSATLRRTFYDQVGRDLAQNWFAPIRQWCRAHGVLSSGHLLWEENTTHHTPLYGNFLRSMLQLDIPGIDVLSSAPRDGYNSGRRAAILARSAAMLNGSRRLFTESSDFTQQMGQKRFASVDEVSATLAWQAALGVTEFTSYYTYGVCPELTGTTFEALPADQRSVQRSAADYLAINTRIAAVLEPLAASALHADVFLYYPGELMQSAYAPSVKPWEPGATPPELTRIARAYEQALQSLLDAGIMPCVVDGQMLRELRIVDGRCVIAHAVANAVVIPDGCPPPADALPACPVWPMTPELPRQLFQQHQALVLKDNPDICVGVFQQRSGPQIVLVNLTASPQRCQLTTHANPIEQRLRPYETTFIEL